MDYLSVMLTEFLTKEEETLSEICKKAYTDALSHHHPFFVRTAAKLAWLAAPKDRNKIYPTFFPYDKNQEHFKLNE